jgi:DNA-binding transcriptional regulator YhcF (GntR family)
VKPIVPFDSSSPVPPFEQVRSGLAARINDRSLAVGTKLPTVRQLAVDLGVAPNTVARAYRELEEAGLIETRGRAGSFVGASGDQTRRRAQQAAAEYAALTRKLGLADTEALSIVRAALDEGKGRP